MLVESEAAATEGTGSRIRHHLDERWRVDLDRPVGCAARCEPREPVEIANVLALRPTGGPSPVSHSVRLARPARHANAARDRGASRMRSGVRTGWGGSPIGGRSLGGGSPGDG